MYNSLRGQSGIYLFVHITKKCDVYIRKCPYDKIHNIHFFTFLYSIRSFLVKFHFIMNMMITHIFGSLFLIIYVHH